MRQLHSAVLHSRVRIPDLQHDSHDTVSNTSHALSSPPPPNPPLIPARPPLAPQTNQPPPLPDSSNPLGGLPLADDALALEEALLERRAPRLLVGNLLAEPPVQHARAEALQRRLQLRLLVLPRALERVRREQPRRYARARVCERREEVQERGCQRGVLREDRVQGCLRGWQGRVCGRRAIDEGGEERRVGQGVG